MTVNDIELSDLNQSNEEIIELIASAIKNALIYGYKIRFLHTITFQLVTLKFKNSNFFKQFFKKLLKSIKLGTDHAKILALFATFYRVLLVSLSKLHKNKKNKLINSFISGFMGGIFVYGGVLNSQWKNFLNNDILTQITLYCMSRVLMAIGKDVGREINRSLLIHNEKKIERIGWIITCGITWGTVMMYYSKDKEFYLQKAMRLSLDFIYGPKIYSWLEAFKYGKR